jgi:hypothetical protein
MFLPIGYDQHEDMPISMTSFYDSSIVKNSIFGITEPVVSDFNFSDQPTYKDLFEE